MGGRRARAWQAGATRPAPGTTAGAREPVAIKSPAPGGAEVVTGRRVDRRLIRRLRPAPSYPGAGERLLHLPRVGIPPPAAEARDRAASDVGPFLLPAVVLVAARVVVLLRIIVLAILEQGIPTL